MNKIVTGILLVLVLMASGCITSPGEQEKVLTVYAYDSLEYWLKEVIPEFEEEYNVKVNLVLVGSTGELVNRLIIEKDNPKADVVVGIDNTFMSKAIKAGVLEKYKPRNVDVIPQWIIEKFDPEFYLTPFDYGYIAFNYRTDLIQDYPKSLDDLTKPEWKGKIIIEDPRTSSPGLAFMLWTIAVYKDQWLDYWAKLRENVQIVKGWSAAWEAFSKGEYPIVLSYATSPAASVYYENNTNIRAIEFEEGNFLQIEGVGIVKGTKNRELAEKFVEFLISEKAQEKLPTTQWMYPVNKNVKLPEVYKYALEVKKPVTIDPALVAENLDKWLKQWTEVVVEGKSPEEVKGQ
ncbi:thiamine ABC transporter substrate-binding protein [Pyrococcus furiosus DSM 3638]|uniref:Thiamin-binding periplasmic protein n=3 Tax=Pyrococcus furiosus TaxID=2261 RepID=Q8U0R6_PYRFU|nr:thiamine ABC transporter substrate binding subunit [Pyrococcus furiosus]AAL81642.1 thiamin-binding periplasmic protein precursor [Pyrococcus furiosus DSM 3638]AFN04301.1 thiamin-binding periplasmic protein [Pyrococcus furiosus COM1]QEK79143.1 thiamine ABC transporter substrate-binding protein [Pyrococcus furiosus DSM 3638]